MLITAGPTTENHLMHSYASLIKKHGVNGIRLVKYIRSPYKYLAAADVTCTMAGYNTCVPLMFYGKKSILIPHEFNHCVCSDQMPRAKMLNKHLGSTVISERATNAKKLALEISRLLKRRNDKTQPCFPKEYFAGSSTTAKILMGMI
jgi:predicted glycosyltransferase